MSWQGWIDSMMSTTSVKGAAITGQDGNTWAHSAGFTPNPAEMKAICDALRAGNVASARLMICGAKYVFLRNDEDDGVKYVFCRNGNEGACIALTKSACVIGTFGEGQAPGNCNQVVLRIAASLLGNGL